LGEERGPERSTCIPFARGHPNVVEDIFPHHAACKRRISRP
jgi:hypothetical protein